MGKKGKERKRKRLLAGNNPDLDNTRDEVEDSNEDAGNSDKGKDDGEENETTDVRIFTEILQLLARNKDLYQTKRLKAFRKAIFPLLSVQRYKFFEPDPLEAACSDEQEIDRILSPQNLATSIRCATCFSNNKESFNSLCHKFVRKALHPIVNLHFLPDAHHTS